VVPPSDGLSNKGLLGRVRLAVGAFPPGDTYSEVEYEALGA